MIIVLKPNSAKEEAQEILQLIESKGLQPLYMPGVERVVIGAIGDERKLTGINFAAFPCVDSIRPILSKYKLVSRELFPHDTTVKIGDRLIGNNQFSVIAGPCSVESKSQLSDVAKMVKDFGAMALRGGAYKPRTSPYDFQGLGVEGLKLLAEAREETGLPVVTEVMDVLQLPVVLQYADCLQIGARNMQNYALLKAVGQSKKPVMLKRGLSATIEELLLAAEYILSEGNQDVILCERGIRTFETATRNTLDLNAVAVLKQKTHLPVFVDPSHGTGVRELVIPLSKAAVAVGADGIIVEAHMNPKEALSDGHQALTAELFEKLMSEIKPFVAAAGKTL